MSPIIADNVRKGYVHQYKLYVDEMLNGHFELAVEHFKAYEILLDVYQDYIPCVVGELCH